MVTYLADNPIPTPEMRRSKRDILIAYGRRLIQDDCSGMAAETAYTFILSFFPLLLLAATSASFFGHGRHTVETVSASLREFMPAESHALIETYVSSLFATGRHSGLFSISLVILLWTGSSLMATLIKSLNRIYRMAPASMRPWWRERAIAIILVPIVFIPVIGASIFAIMGTKLADILDKTFGTGIITSHFWGLTKWFLFILVVAIISCVIYYVGPARRQRVKAVIPGAILSSMLWGIVTLGFNIYVDKFGSYNRVYGSIGAFIVLLLWMYLTSFAFIIGGELNAELERIPPAPKPPTNIK
jgi:membrane protein